MQTALVTITTAIAIVLIHLSYVDFRFRYRDGMLWFWLLNPAPPLMWIGRGTVVLALLVALAGPLIGIGKTYALLLAVLMGLHIVTLILLEVLEPR